ncbi:MAG TPA: sugar phosphate isomerase/epimerase [Nitrolancea sp.]|nr:sugar phosphate isomerase/epimerase [Nitrolancea sp.]
MKSDSTSSPTIICSTGSFAGQALSTRFRLARAAGTDGVELMLSPRLVRGEPREVRRLEDEHHTPVRSVHSVLRLRDVSSEQAADDITTSARFAAQLHHCRVLVVHPPQVDSLHDTAGRHWLEALEASAEIGARAGFAIAVENLGQLTRRGTASALDHPSRLKWLAEEWDVALTFDTSHAGSRGWNLVEVSDLFGPRLANLHLSDLGARTYRWALTNALVRDHRLPGTGTLPLRSLLEHLASRHYSGLLTLELSPLALRAWWRPSTLARLRAAVLNCRVQTHSSQPSSHPTTGPDPRG